MSRILNLIRVAGLGVIFAVAAASTPHPVFASSCNDYTIEPCMDCSECQTLANHSCGGSESINGSQCSGGTTACGTHYCNGGVHCAEICEF